MTIPPVILDKVSRVTPLGVRFWDSLINSSVGEGLEVTAYRPNRPERRFMMTRTRSDSFLLQNIRLVDEFGEGDDAYWEAHPPSQAWVVEVRDTSRRFLPFSFSAMLPHRGLFGLECASPPDGSRMVPLFSAASRVLPGAFGSIAADLRDASRFDPRNEKYAPAAYAMVEAHYEGEQLGRGWADADGAIVIPISYPEPINPPFASPHAQRIPLSDQQWEVELRVFYSPESSPPGSPALPDLCAALNQRPAVLNTLSPPPASPTIVVQYGVHALLRTPGRSDCLITTT